MLRVMICLGLAWVGACARAGSTHLAAAPPQVLEHELPLYEAPAGLDGGVSIVSPLRSRAEEPRASTAADASSPDTWSIGLPQLIEATVLNDPRIRAAFADVLRARAERLGAQVFDNPNLTFSQTLNPFANHAFTPTRQGGPPQLDIGINYSLERLLFGQRGAAIEAADRRSEAELAAYTDVARERVFSAITAYVDVLEAKDLARLARQEVEQLERLESITARRVALGSVGQVELSRVHIAVIGGRRRELTSRVEQDNTLTRLRARLGARFLRAQVDVVDQLDVTPRTPPAFDALLQRALAARPDLREQELRVVAARASEERERRKGMPKVNVGVGYTRQFQDRTLDFPDARSWGASLGTSLPVSDRNQGGVATARAELFQAQAQVEALKLELHAELEQALRQLNAAEQILASYDPEAMQAAEKARDTIEEAYGLGGRTLLELLDAQRTYRDVYRDHVTARADYLRALHRLNAIVGEEVLR
jgi:cobalt-zinc-cadmium efflux system outer membrane protein